MVPKMNKKFIEHRRCYLRQTQCGSPTEPMEPLDCRALLTAIALGSIVPAGDVVDCSSRAPQVLSPPGVARQSNGTIAFPALCLPRSRWEALSRLAMLLIAPVDHPNCDDRPGKPEDEKEKAQPDVKILFFRPRQKFLSQLWRCGDRDGCISR